MALPILRTELSSAAATSYYLAGLLQNTDPILNNYGGGDLRVYEELLRDDQAGPALDQRIAAIAKAETIVDPASDAAEDVAAADFIREQLSAIDWDGKVEKMLFAIWYGYSVAEVIWNTDGQRIVIGDIKVRPPNRFRFGKDYDKRESSGVYESTIQFPQGTLRPANKYWTFQRGGQDDENPYGRGLAHRCYWPIFFKRNDIKFWLIFLERFGQPTATAKVPESWTLDQGKTRKVLDMLDAVSSDAGVMIPDGVTVELLEASRSASADYAGLHDAMNQAIAKIILGQTLTLENEGGQYKADMQKVVRDQGIKSDADALMNSFNTQVVRWLTTWNFPNAKPPKVWRKLEPDEDLNLRADRDTKIKGLGYSPTDDYIRETYGEGWEKTPDPVMTPGAGAPGARGAAQDFAESVLLLAGKGQNRVDQATIAAAANRFAMQFQDVSSPRIQQIIDFLEGDGSLIELRAAMRDMAADVPDESLIDRFLKGGFVARLAGLLKAQ